MRGTNTIDEAHLRDRRRRVAQMFAEGHTAPYIAVTLNVCLKTVYRDRKELKLSNPKAPPLTAQELTRAREMLSEGCNYAEVARTLGRAARTLRIHFPGYELNRTQVAELAAMGRWLNRLDRKTG
jgi:DNA-binding CsgD family transcriptional regulator